MKINPYVVDGGNGYANWLINNPDGENGKIVNSIEEADIVVFTGGGDVNPYYYNKSKNNRTYSQEVGKNTRDAREWEMMQYAAALGKPMWGTCRGLQLMCAFAGGDLIQHVNHYGDHEIEFYDGTSVMTNTIHHQMIYPFEKLKQGSDYYIIANSLGISDVYLGENNEHLALPKNAAGMTLEPEAGYFPKIKALGQQSHLEMQSYKSPVVRLTRKLVEHLILGTLDEVMENNIPFSELLNPEFKLKSQIVESIKCEC